MRLLRYKDIIHDNGVTENCPHETCKENTLECCRWVKNSIEHDDNFLPTALIDRRLPNPPRRNFKSDKERCIYFSVSFFDTIDNALKRFRAIPDNQRKMLGWTHLAIGILTNEMGVVSDINEHGHFSYFEYQDVTLVDKFRVISELN